MERTTDFIKVWFWARNDNSVPSDVKGSTAVDTDNWVLLPLDYDFAIDFITKQGTPAAAFPNTSCDMSEFFEEHNIIINLTLCKLSPVSFRSCVYSFSGGDWAGAQFSQDGCPGDTCEGKFFRQTLHFRQTSLNRRLEYVNGSPSAFENAYFDILSIRVYTT